MRNFKDLWPQSVERKEKKETWNPSLTPVSTEELETNQQIIDEITYSICSNISIVPTIVFRKWARVVTQNIQVTGE